MLRAAIVGLGSWGQRLVSAVQDDRGGTSEHIQFVRAVTRTLDEKARLFAQNHRLHLDDDFNTMLCDPEIGAVVLATPHSLHVAQIEAAARAGKHVFVEKPVALTRAGAAASIAACQNANVVLAAGHNRRFLPAMQAMKKIVREGQLGTILHLEGNMSHPGALSYSAERWRASPSESPAGGMTGMGIHILDAFVSLAGGIVSVDAQSFRLALPIDIDDTTSVLLRFRNGCTGYLGTISATSYNWRIQAFGNKGWSEVRGNTVLETSFVDRERPETTAYSPHDIERAELECFAMAAAGSAAYPVSANEILEGIAALEAVITSAKERRVVELAEGAPQLAP